MQSHYTSCNPINSRAIVCALCAVLLLGACAARDQARTVLIDQKGVNARVYDLDLAECTAYADQISTGKRVAQDATSGAVLGGVLGAIWGDADGATRSAGAGAVLGGARGGSHAYHEQGRILRNCLINRGYAVLN